MIGLLAALAGFGLWAGSALAASPPTIATSFGASSIPLNGTTTLTFVISAGSSVQNDVHFTDTLPAGLLLAAGVTDDCGGNSCGTLTATPGTSTVSLSGTPPSPVLPPNGSRTITVHVTGTWGGEKDNSVTVSSANGTGNTSMASLTVLPPASTDRIYWGTFGTASNVLAFANLDGSGGGDLPTCLTTGINSELTAI